jgi:hypothetical protein
VNNLKFYRDLDILELGSIDIKAVSGFRGQKELPVGVYEISVPTIIDDVPENEPYKGELFCWWCKIMPLFSTDRDGLGIHPDGNVEGTNGCIGVQKNDRFVFDYLIFFYNSGGRLLEVF